RVFHTYGFAPAPDVSATSRARLRWLRGSGPRRAAAGFLATLQPPGGVARLREDGRAGARVLRRGTRCRRRAGARPEDFGSGAGSDGEARRALPPAPPHRDPR